MLKWIGNGAEHFSCRAEILARVNGFFKKIEELHKLNGKQKTNRYHFKLDFCT